MFDIDKLTEEELNAYKEYRRLKKERGTKWYTPKSRDRQLFRQYRAIRHLESLFPKNYLDPFSIPKEFDKDLEEYHNLLNNSTDERPLQKFLEKNPYFIGSLLKRTQFGHHDTYVFSEFQLANKYRPDFVICGMNSGGFGWFFIELQSPNCKILLKNGMPAEQAREGLHQIQLWKEWLRENLHFARSSLNMHGLHESSIFYYLIIGRRESFGEEENEWRRRVMAEDKSINIISYDRLADFYKELCISRSF